MANTIFDVVIEKIEAQAVPVRNSIAGGAAKDFAGYKDMAGFVRGLETAIREVRDLADSHSNGDNDD